MFDRDEAGRSKMYLQEGTFFSYKNIEELVELAGQPEAAYEYGIGNRHRKMIRIPAARHYSDPSKAMYSVEGRESMVGDVSYYKVG